MCTLPSFIIFEILNKYIEDNVTPNHSKKACMEPHFHSRKRAYIRVSQACVRFNLFVCLQVFACPTGLCGSSMR